MGGRIELIMGPMFAGKTSELIRRIKRFAIADKKCIVLKHGDDVRYSKNNVVTHDGILHCSFPIATRLWDVWDMVQAYNVVGIDEGQFFPDVASFSNHLADNGKIVIVTALNAKFNKNPFDNVLELVPLAEKMTKLNAICSRCHSKAAFTQRLQNLKTDVLIGGSDMYRAVCRDCYTR